MFVKINISTNNIIIKIDHTIVRKSRPKMWNKADSEVLCLRIVLNYYEGT